MKGIGGHQKTKGRTNTWLTPPSIIQSLGPFDLDPCTPVSMPDGFSTATKRYTPIENGLLMPWHGFVWCNPPYGREVGEWLSKMAMHNDGIALVFARTETAAFFDWVWPFAESVFFIKGRIHFYDSNGIRAKANSGAPSVLIAYGKEADKRLRKTNIRGIYLKINPELIQKLNDWYPDGSVCPQGHDQAL